MKSMLEDELIQQIIGDRNGCTLPVQVPLGNLLLTDTAHMGRDEDQSGVFNRYFNQAGKAFHHYLAASELLEGQSIYEILGFSLRHQLHMADFGSVTSSETPLDRLLLPRAQAGQIGLQLHETYRAIYARLQKANHHADICLIVASLFDIKQAVEIGNDTNTRRGRSLLTQIEQLKHDKNLTDREITRGLFEAFQQMLGWDQSQYGTINAIESGTYQNSLFSILGGLDETTAIITTTETGGNAPRFASMQRGRFGATLAGDYVASTGDDVPILSNGARPKIVRVLSLRGTDLQPHWGMGKQWSNYGEYVVAHIDEILADGQIRSLVVNIPDRPKTGTAITVDDLRIVSKRIEQLKQQGITAFFILDGCQMRGDSIQAMMYPKGALAFFEEQHNILLDGFFGTFSKGPSGTPFSSFLILRPEHQATLNEVLRSDALQDYRQQYLAASWNFAEGQVPHDTVPNYKHLVRLLADYPRLLRWGMVNQKNPEIEQIKKALLAELQQSPLLQVLPGNSDPSILNLTLNPAYEKFDLTVIAKLMRFGFRLDRLDNQPTLYDRAAALFATPTGQTVIEATQNYDYESPQSVQNVPAHDPIIRFAINLELAEYYRFDPDKAQALMTRLGKLIRTRLQLILTHYEVLTAELAKVEQARAEAESLYFQSRSVTQ